MFKNYLVVALRSLKRQKAFSLINISGLAVGMLGFALFARTAAIRAYADRFHRHADRIHALVQVVPSETEEEKHTAFVPAPLPSALIEEYPEIEDVVRVLPPGRMTVRRGDESFYENGILFVDSNFLEFFTFDMASGNSETVLSELNSVVLSEAAAFKYFGNADPIGRVLTLNQQINVRVTGVTKNLKRTSSIQFDFLVPLEASRSLYGRLDEWSYNRYAGFVRLADSSDRKDMDAKLTAFIDKHLPKNETSAKRLYLFSFLDMRLRGGYIHSMINSSHPAANVILISVGVLLLLVVSINFINMSMARHMYRAKEVGMRKVVGARRGQLIRQMLGESILMSLLALPVAILLYEIAHPIVYSSSMNMNPVTGMMTHVSNSIWNYPFLLKYLFIAAVLTGLFSGLYPAITLSGFRPVEILQKSISLGKKRSRGRKVMIVFQFMLSVVFIVTASVLKEQLYHILKADYGYEKSGMATIQITEQEGSYRDILRTEILKHPGVESVSGSARLPIVWENWQQARLPGAGEEEGVRVGAYGVGYNFVETMGIELLAGRDFSETDGKRAGLILNETAVARLNIQDPLGKQLTIGDHTGTVVGVVKDFLFSDVGFEMPPAVLSLDPEDVNVLLIRLSSTADYQEFHERLRTTWQTIVPDVPFECKMLDDHFSVFFGLVRRIAGLFNAIGLAAVFFSCLGLLGLTSFVVERRTKEIGIRKVLGAPLMRVHWELAREFLVLVAIANAIAIPLIFFGWQRVLRTGLLFLKQIHPWTVLFAASIALLTAILAVVSQTWKAARTNPVDSLRYE
jgi:putative ABC transport system permease protein